MAPYLVQQGIQVVCETLDPGRIPFELHILLWSCRDSNPAQKMRGCNSRVARIAGDLASAAARTALSHYIFPDADGAAKRREIRAAAGLAAQPS
jgi:hypothetical protein